MLKLTLQDLAGKGHRGFDCSDSSLEKLADWGAEPQQICETLQDIRLDLGDCQRCRLAEDRKNIVFGAGSHSAKLVFVGEGPGFEEDQQGEPFVGPAGQLLTKIIEAIHLRREQVYICNIVKCRPPRNRNPQPDEIKTCFQFLDRQIAAIRPDFICALGSVAAQTLLNTAVPISRLRGRFHDYKDLKLLPTYHPAYLLRNPEKKRDVWQDMKMLMKEYPYET
ncbi:MAG: uracil-DNA glycosylase [Desulfobacterales bacterium]|jgi:DNA polymerase|nr:uracil-DNA glycosylase [Desulfobacterales bacterium]MDH4010043.1 uracil-DNA glycosylase [Desulfobacterales bacterium]